MHNEQLISQPFTRRNLLVGGLAAAATASLAACSAPLETPTQPLPTQSGGRFRIGLLGGSGADTIDPTHGSSSIDQLRFQQMYDTLTRMNEDGEVELHLAEELTMESPDSWVVRVREGVTFHDGSTLDADDVIHTLERSLGPESRTATRFQVIDPDSLTKLDDRTVRIGMAIPAYYLNEILSTPAASIVPVGFDSENPIGSGPFSLRSFTPGQQVEYERFDDYWQGAVSLDEIEVITFADESARVNALQSGQIDHAPRIAASYLSVVESADGVHVHNYPSALFENIVLNAESEEFGDPEVRRAMKMLINRAQIRDQVYGGHAAIGNDINEPTSIYYNDTLPQWEEDVDEAMSILRARGASDTQFEMIAAPLTTTLVNLAEVVTQQLVEAGLDARLSQIDAGSYYGPGFGERPFTIGTWGGWTFATFADLSQLPGGAFQESRWENEDFISAFRAASLASDEDSRRQHIWDAQEIMHAESGTIIPAHMNVLDGYADHVTGYKTDALGMGGGGYDYTAVQLD